MTAMCNEIIKLGVLFVGRQRPGFDMEWGAAVEKRVCAALGTTSFEIFEPPQKVVDEPTLRTALADCIEAGVSVVLALQSTMADARLVLSFSQSWPDPILLWATPEKPDGQMISSCSLVGVQLWASILRRLEHPFEILCGDPDDQAVLGQLQVAVRVAFACRKLRTARLGVVGGQAPGFLAMAMDPMVLQRTLGPQQQNFTLLEFTEVVASFPEDRVAVDVEAVKALGIPHKDTSDDDLPTASRLYLAMRHFMDEEGCEALAVRCWPEMPRVCGQWPYLGMVRLAEEGRAIACEGDGDGALNALICEQLGIGPCYLSDWLEHDQDTITLWHAGLAPFSLSCPRGEAGGPQIARHFNFPNPAVVDSVLAPEMNVTCCRLWRLGEQYHLTAFEGRTEIPKRQYLGTHGVVRLTDPSGPGPERMLRHLCDAGMPHHMTMVEGHHAALLRSFARMAGIGWVPVGDQ